MARVVDAEVKEIIETDLSDTAPFITAANLVVTDRLGSSDDLSDAQLKEIERWFAAHLVAVRDPVSISSKTGDSLETFARGKLGEELKSTPYGQMVIVLDTTGKMASLGKKAAVFKAIDLDL